MLDIRICGFAGLHGIRGGTYGGATHGRYALARLVCMVLVRMVRMASVVCRVCMVCVCVCVLRMVWFVVYVQYVRDVWYVCTGLRCFVSYCHCIVLNPNVLDLSCLEMSWTYLILLRLVAHCLVSYWKVFDGFCLFLFFTIRHSAFICWLSIALWLKYSCACDCNFICIALQIEFYLHCFVCLIANVWIV